MPLLSSLTGRVDPKRVYLGSVALTAIAFAGLARVATGFWSALAFRALMGTVASAVETVSVTAEAFGWLRTRAALSRLPMTLLWTHRAMGSSLVVHGSVGRTHWRSA